MVSKFPYFTFYLAAQTKYQVHSPFVFEFLNDVFEDERYYHFFGVIENYRQQLLKLNEKVKIGTDAQSIKAITKTKAISPTSGELLFKAVHLYKPETILEIGTNFGIASLYQATPNPHAPLITLEQNPNIARQTRHFFKKLGTRNITIYDGAIETTLTKALATVDSIEFLLFNQLEKKEQMMRYFEQCRPHLLPNSVVVLRTPYANEDSIAFWEYLKQQPIVKLSIDVFDLGFLFFRNEQRAVAHTKLIEAWKKPWAFI